MLVRFFRPPLAPPNLGGESPADNSSPESGEVRRGLNGRMSFALLQTTPGPILCKQIVPVGRAPEQARLPVAFPDSGGESPAANSSPESGEVRRGLNVRMMTIMEMAQ